MNIDWKNGKLNKCVILSKLGNKCTIRSDGPVQVTEQGKPIETIELEKSVIEFNTKAGHTYVIVSDTDNSM